MLEDVLQELNNWFLCPDGVHLGHYQVEDGSISLPFLSPGQYFRILGSVYNDGLYQYPTPDLTDESFDGAVTARSGRWRCPGRWCSWRMRSPPGSRKTARQPPGLTPARALAVTAILGPPHPMAARWAGRTSFPPGSAAGGKSTGPHSQPRLCRPARPGIRPTKGGWTSERFG